MKKRNVSKFPKYRPYAPQKTGITMAQAEREVGVAPGQPQQFTREDLEQAIANAARKYGYTMRGTLDAALASGAMPMIAVSDDGEKTLMGWRDAKGNVVKV